jgi:lipoprotein-anchoring transpeptidase ErfK/SrfK
LRRILLIVAILGGTAHAEVRQTTRGTAIRTKPDGKAAQRGATLKGAKFDVLAEEKGRGCKADWVRIGDDAWVCGDDLTATDEAATTDKLPVVPANGLTPYEYVIGYNAYVYPSMDAAATKKHGRKQIGHAGLVVLEHAKDKDGAEYVRTDLGWLRLADVTVAQPSTFQGITVDASTKFPLAYIVEEPAGHLYDADGNALGADAKSPVTFRQVVPQIGAKVALGKKKGKKQLHGYEVAKGVYVDATIVRVIDVTKRPKGVGESERWIDVSIGEQTLVAYQGDQPIFATLVSTAHNTPRGLHHIQNKRPHPTLESTKKYSDKNKYHYETPWVMSLTGRYALHSVYWHDAFGAHHGQGCVNLAPHDAQYIWDFTEPALPAGWAYADAVDGHGTAVLIRD